MGRPYVKMTFEVLCKDKCEPCEDVREACSRQKAWQVPNSERLCLIPETQRRSQCNWSMEISVAEYGVKLEDR